MSIFALKPGIVVPVWVILSAMSSALAAERSNQIQVTDAQLRAIGIELIEVHAQSSAGVSFPAEVVLPHRQQRVVSAPVAGLVSQVLVEENQVVVVGTPLVVLNSPQFGQLQLAVVLAVNHARLAAQTTLRERALFKEGIIAERRVQEAEIAASNSRAELAQAKAAVMLAGLSEREVNLLIEVGKVQHELTLTAQSAGTVILLEAKPGQRVTEIDPLLRIAQLGELWIDIQVPAAEASQWPAGSTLRITGDIEAKVRSVSPTADDAQRVLLRAQLRGGTANLHPGEFVQATLPVVTADAWEVPLSALARDGDEAYVFVRIDDRFVVTKVEVLANAGQRATVKGPLQIGQRLAATGVISLKAAWQGAGGMAEE